MVWTLRLAPLALLAAALLLWGLRRIPGRKGAAIGVAVAGLVLAAGAAAAGWAYAYEGEAAASDGPEWDYSTYGS